MAAMGSSPEEIRLRYLYRRVVLGGKARLPLEAARMLVGPDCAFHLYATLAQPGAEAPAGDQPGIQADAPQV
jgi:hypothetical protein